MRIATYDEHPFGLSWVLDEPMQRTSHAIVADGRVWFIDPVDVPEALERAAGLGAPAGVIQLLDRHKRDCAAIAARLGVPHLENPSIVPGSPFEAIPVVRWPAWKETALWWGAERVLVVSEAIGTHPVWTTGNGAAGVHAMLRMLPPGALRGRQPEHLLVGHGAGLHGPGTPGELERALGRSRRDAPRLLLKVPDIIRLGR